MSFDLIAAVQAFCRTLFYGKPNPSEHSATRTTTPIERRVLVITFNPKIASQGGRTLSDVLGWYDPAQLTQQLVDALVEASYGYLHYRVVETVDLDEWPLKADGFRYDETTFLTNWQSQTGWHQPDLFDYPRFVADHALVDRVESGEVDEIWLWAMPFAGFWESYMGGQAAYPCNAPDALPYTGSGTRRFIIMGFNYQRLVASAIHSFTHRVEAIMEHTWHATPPSANLWTRFIRHEATDPGQSQVGTVHFPPNGERDYDWGNHRTVQSAADDWLTFPTLPGQFKATTCEAWGCTEHGYLMWWLKRLPHVPGQTGGISSNWWEYAADPNVV